MLRIASATIEDCDLATTIKPELGDSEVEIMLEAARRATWDALYGPKHLRSGRCDPGEEGGLGNDEAARLDAAADEQRDDATARQDPSRAARR